MVDLRAQRSAQRTSGASRESPSSLPLQGGSSTSRSHITLAKRRGGTFLEAQRTYVVRGAECFVPRAWYDVHEAGRGYRRATR